MMTRESWLKKLKTKNLVTLHNTTTKQKINTLIHRMTPESIVLNNGVIVGRNTGQSIDYVHTIEPIK
jgi:hypothetical protein